jgi:hypothetical protein
MFSKDLPVMKNTPCCAFFGIKYTSRDAPQPPLLLLARFEELVLPSVAGKCLTPSKDHGLTVQRANKADRTKIRYSCWREVSATRHLVWLARTFAFDIHDRNIGSALPRHLCCSRQWCCSVAWLRRRERGATSISAMPSFARVRILRDGARNLRQPLVSANLLRTVISTKDEQS